jgi:hypothetical protein
MRNLMIIADEKQRGDEVPGVRWKLPLPVPRRTGNFHKPLIFLS